MKEKFLKRSITVKIILAIFLAIIALIIFGNKVKAISIGTENMLDDKGIADGSYPYWQVNDPYNDGRPLLCVEEHRTVLRRLGNKSTFSTGAIVMPILNSSGGYIRI